MAKFLVTGGAGFIGSSIVRRLLKDGHSVRIIDNLSTGKISNLEGVLQDVEFIQENLASYGVAEKAVKGMDYILHQAAIPSVQRSINDPIATNESIVTATIMLFNAVVKDGGVRRVVQAASSSAYGDTIKLPKSEDMTPNPLSPYAVAKLTQEYYAQAFYNVYGVEIFSLRYFNVFGPNQDPMSFYAAVIPKFIKLMMGGKNPVIYGDGSNSRDFTYISNVIEANLLACFCKWPGQSEVINIGCGRRTTLNEIVDLINRIIGSNTQPIYEMPKIGDVKHSLADIRKAREIIVYKPIVELEEGLIEMVERYKSEKRRD